MKAKSTFPLLAMLGLIFAIALPLTAAADGCPPDDPHCAIEPPQSIEVNPDPRQADGSPVELDEPGVLAPVQISVPMPLPRRVDPLAVPMRYQDPDDPTCGVQALGMALEGINGQAPTSEALLRFLEDQGMMYGFGTGVEELAYAAQTFGYEGSLPFHGWTLADLQNELAAGRPVVVSLGANGEGKPGHFVTVTGISSDQIQYNDPTLGKQVISIEAFLRLWALEGSSGVAVRQEPPAADSVDYAPWVAISAGLMALISQTPLALRRKGIGGRLDVVGVGNGRGPAPPGYRWVFRQVPTYEWRTVQDGWDVVPRTVPKMVRKRVQVGWTAVTERIPRYKTVRVQEGWTTTYERVPVFRTERYIRSWRTEISRRPTYRYIRGRRIFTGYRTVRRRVPVYGSRRVFAGWRTQRKRVPRMVERRVFDGWDFVQQRVPEYEWREVQDGWRVTTVQVPHMVRRRVQVGTEWRWELEVIPEPVVYPVNIITPSQQTVSDKVGCDSALACPARGYSFGSCVLDAIFTLANGIGSLLVFTGVGTTIGFTLLVANGVYQAIQFISDYLAMRRGEISREHFFFNQCINLADAVPVIGFLSGIFGLMNTCIFEWAFQWSPNSPDNRR